MSLTQVARLLGITDPETLRSIQEILQEARRTA